MEPPAQQSGCLETAIYGSLVGVVGLLLLSIVSGALGMMMAGSGCLVLPFLIVVGGGMGSLGGVVYYWYYVASDDTG